MWGQGWGLGDSLAMTLFASLLQPLILVSLNYILYSTMRYSALDIDIHYWFLYLGSCKCYRSPANLSGCDLLVKRHGLTVSCPSQEVPTAKSPTGQVE